MKILLSFLSLIVFTQLFAGSKESLTLWLDSTVQTHEIDWIKVQSDFENYTRDNYKYSTSVSAFLLQFRPKKPYKGKMEYTLIEPDKYEALKLMSKESIVILKELEDFLLELILTQKLYKSQNPYTYSWIYLQHLNSFPLNDTPPNLMTSELLKLQGFTRSEGDLFEKLGLLILSRKIFFENEYITSDILISQLPKTPTKYTDFKKEKNQADETGDDSNQIALFSEVEPQFIGGMDNLSTFIQLNVSYPKKALEYGERGVVYVQFVVGLDGSIEDVAIIKGISPPLDQEAFRVVSMMPKWLPAMQNNINVKVKFTLPINFSLH